MSNVSDNLLHSHRQLIQQTISASRLRETVARLVDARSPTGSARPAADALADILVAAGFSVERPVAGHPASPAVVTRYSGSRPGRILQLSGHLDTVHLPFSPARVDGQRLYGSGSVDMKGGIAAAVEALIVLRDTRLLKQGSILLTACDLHECPWGDNHQLESLIKDGCVGDAVLIPEYLNDRLPLAGRGGLIWRILFRREAPATHELMRSDEPDMLRVLTECAERLRELDAELVRITHPIAGSESAFIGQIHGGSLYNQAPQEVWLEGTRRWLPGTTQADVEKQLHEIALLVGQKHHVQGRIEFKPMRGPFELDPNDEIVRCFQESHHAVSGKPLPFGAKPFVDDGNTFSTLANIPAITHGPVGSGAHTECEWVSLPDLERVALLYALTAIPYCAQVPRK
jgi:acetylornithine deacetylase/succinyl-diaminopimelate desuccinylase-like protein